MVNCSRFFTGETMTEVKGYAGSTKFVCILYSCVMELRYLLSGIGLA